MQFGAGHPYFTLTFMVRLFPAVLNFFNNCPHSSKPRPLEIILGGCISSCHWLHRQNEPKFNGEETKRALINNLNNVPHKLV